MTVVVVTDSSARLPEAIRDAYDVRQVPLHVLVDGESSGTQRDLGEDVDDIGPEVYNDPATTTSGATPADLTSAFAAAVEDSDGDGVVAVSMSRKLSSTWSSARLAADSFRGRVRVVDSRSVGLAVGFAAVAAAQAVRGGGDLDRAYEAAIRAGTTSESLLCVARLDNLRASGRISAATRLFGSALSIKPVLRVVDGELVLAERQRTFSRAVSKLVDTAVESAGRRSTTVGVLHADASEVADRVVDEITRRVSLTSPIVVAHMGPVLSSHVGSGAVSVATCADLGPLAGWPAA